MRSVLWIFLFASGCSPGLVPAMSRASEPAYGQFEDPEVNGECVIDRDCIVSGCSTCAAKKSIEAPLFCDTPHVASDGGYRFDALQCACISGSCRWAREP